jgi:ACS family tartrate transporter-like MFS transporter
MSPDFEKNPTGYFLLDIPGSILVERWIAGRWIAGILVMGLLASFTSTIQTRTELSCMRFLLGLAEGGFLRLSSST